MALSQKLELRHSQALVMTPQLMQAIKLLQLSNLDLAGYVETELERNPLLERAEEGEGAPAPEGAEAQEHPGDWGEARESERGEATEPGDSGETEDGAAAGSPPG